MDLNRVRARIEMRDAVAVRVAQRDRERIVLADRTHEYRVIGTRRRGRQDERGQANDEDDQTSGHEDPLSDSDSPTTVAATRWFCPSRGEAASRPPLSSFG